MLTQFSVSTFLVRRAFGSVWSDGVDHSLERLFVDGHVERGAGGSSWTAQATQGVEERWGVALEPSSPAPREPFLNSVEKYEPEPDADNNGPSNFFPYLLFCRCFTINASSLLSNLPSVLFSSRNTIGNFFPFFHLPLIFNRMEKVDTNSFYLTLLSKKR